MKMILNAVYRLRGGLYGRVTSTQDDVDKYTVTITTHDTPDNALAGCKVVNEEELTIEGYQYLSGSAGDLDAVELVHTPSGILPSDTTAQLGDYTLTLNADGTLHVEHVGDTLLVCFDGANAVKLDVKKVQL